MPDKGAKEGALSAPAASGEAYVPSSAQPVTEWSDAVYRELTDWASVLAGRWERWAPEYLVLTIDTHGGSAIEPVVIDTYEGELTVTFGFWETHLPGDGIYDDSDSHRASKAAKTLVSDWLEGRTATAIYFDIEDKWCGSKLLETPQDASLIGDIEWIETFRPVRVEIRKSQKSEWQHFRLGDENLSSAVSAALKR